MSKDPFGGLISTIAFGFCVKYKYCCCQRPHGNETQEILERLSLLVDYRKFCLSVLPCSCVQPLSISPYGFVVLVRKQSLCLNFFNVPQNIGDFSVKTI